MTVLFGHPTGNPNSHHAALAHFQAGWLEAFCVPWMPTQPQLSLLARVPGLSKAAARVARRRFEPLASAPKVQGRLGEWGRMARRLVGGAWADERLAYEANDWLMRAMRRECRRAAVTAVHSYEDCSLLQFREAARRGLLRIYDLPIGYYPAWEAVLAALAHKYGDWLPGAAGGRSYARPEQKREEMRLADVVLAPSSFVARTVREFADRDVALAPYGVDCAFWSPDRRARMPGPFRFLSVGHCSVRKGTPLLIEAWRAADLKDAVLEIVGSWQLASGKRDALSPNLTVTAPMSATDLRERFRQADVFVFPSNFEGFSLAMLEAMACGLPAIVSEAASGHDFLDETAGRVVPTDNRDALVDALRWFNDHRDAVAAMRQSARRKMESMTWARYRTAVRDAVRPRLSGSGTLPGPGAI